MAKVSLAGIHYPDTTGDVGITDATEPLAERGWFVEGQRLYIASLQGRCGNGRKVGLERIPPL